jgi:ATP/maltotriose-dependent transcriptional regulator MalT
MSELFREVVATAEKAAVEDSGPVANDIHRLLANATEIESGNDRERTYLAVLLDSIGFREESARILHHSSGPEQIGANASLRNVEGMLAVAHGDYDRARQILKDALQAASDSPVLRVKIQANLAAASWGAGAVDVAEAWAEAARAQQEHLTPASAVLVASVRAEIASARSDLETLRAASASLGVASKARIAELGVHHPQALATVANMARIQVLLARAED